MNPNFPFLLEDPVLSAIAKKHKQTPALVALRYQIQRGVVVLAKSYNKKRIKENIQVMSWAVGRGVLRNILHEDHSLSVSQDFPWIKTSYQFFPMHECVVCVPGDFLLLIWQQERQYGWRGFRLDRKQRFWFRSYVSIYSVILSKWHLIFFVLIAICDFF